MTTMTDSIQVSPVNMENRQNLGIRPGDTVRVWQKIEEKGKTRLQAFEGVVLARKHGNEPGATFTVRRVSGGVGVEKIFPLYSPVIDKIEIVKRSKVRRAKLYYIREKAAKEIKRQMRRMTLMNAATVSEAEEKERLETEAKEAEEKAAKEAEEKATKEAEEAARQAQAEKAEAGEKAAEETKEESEEKAEDETPEEKQEEPKEAAEEKTEQETKEEAPTEEEKK